MVIEVIGADRVELQFRRLANLSQAGFIDEISKMTLYLLRNNTPVDTGELRDSWAEMARTDTTVSIGTRPNQLPKLRGLVNGTRYTQPNDFITPVLEVIADNIDSVMRRHLQRSHPYLRDMSSGTGVKTSANIVGLTGLKYVKRRGRGRSYLGKITLKRKQLRPVIRRMRRV